MPFIFAVLFLMTSSMSLADEKNYLCDASETLIFGCQLEDKLISLCASSEFSNEEGYVQYRYGLPGIVEYMYPETASISQGVFFLSHTAYSGGGAATVRFKTDSVEHFIFDSMIRTNFNPEEPSYPKFSSGIVTRNDETTISVQLCRNNDASIRSAAYRAFDREEFDPSIIP